MSAARLLLGMILVAVASDGLHMVRTVGLNSGNVNETENLRLSRPTIPDLNDTFIELTHRTIQQLNNLYY